MTYKVVKELQNGFQIGRFRVYPAHNKIEIEERTASIEPKVMHVLCFLVENNGSVVSRDTLAESLWPNQVVSYDVITRAIFELRKVFSDSAKEPQFIETISRKGYCFICPVTLLEKRDELSVTKKSKIHHPKNLIAGIFFNCTCIDLSTLFFYSKRF